MAKYKVQERRLASTLENINGDISILSNAIKAYEENLQAEHYELMLSELANQLELIHPNEFALKNNIDSFFWQCICHLQYMPTDEFISVAGLFKDKNHQDILKNCLNQLLKNLEQSKSKVQAALQTIQLLLKKDLYLTHQIDAGKSLDNQFLKQLALLKQLLINTPASSEITTIVSKLLAHNAKDYGSDSKRIENIQTTLRQWYPDIRESIEVELLAHSTQDNTISEEYQQTLPWLKGTISNFHISPPQRNKHNMIPRNERQRIKKAENEKRALIKIDKYIEESNTELSQFEVCKVVSQQTSPTRYSPLRRLVTTFATEDPSPRKAAREFMCRTSKRLFSNTQRRLFDSTIQFGPNLLAKLITLHQAITTKTQVSKALIAAIKQYNSDYKTLSDEYNAEITINSNFEFIEAIQTFAQSVIEQQEPSSGENTAVLSKQYLSILKYLLPKLKIFEQLHDKIIFLNLLPTMLNSCYDALRGPTRIDPKLFFVHPLAATSADIAKRLYKDIPNGIANKDLKKQRQTLKIKMISNLSQEKQPSFEEELKATNKEYQAMIAFMRLTRNVIEPNPSTTKKDRVFAAFKKCMNTVILRKYLLTARDNLKTMLNNSDNAHNSNAPIVSLLRSVAISFYTKYIKYSRSAIKRLLNYRHEDQVFRAAMLRIITVVGETYILLSRSPFHTVDLSLTYELMLLRNMIIHRLRLGADMVKTVTQRFIFGESANSPSLPSILRQSHAMFSGLNIHPLSPDALELTKIDLGEVCLYQLAGRKGRPMRILSDKDKAKLQVHIQERNRLTHNFTKPPEQSSSDTEIKQTLALLEETLATVPSEANDKENIPPTINFSS